MRKKLPIGIENFERIIEDNYYYVDKTLFIKDLLDNAAAVNLFTRPRRFGKTLTISMVKNFFEKGSNEHLFDGLNISNCGEEYLKHQGKYPVISLTLKSAKQSTWESAINILTQTIADEYRRHSEILDKLSEYDKERFVNIMNHKATLDEYKMSLGFLSNCLKQTETTNVIILIDEYDVPLENAYYQNFYEPMVDFIRSFFEHGLKTNDALQFAIITGCLRISKESIFTGLNNFDINSVLTVSYDEYFGFTDDEVTALLSEYKLDEYKDEMKDWYNGYRFGKTSVYNPWSAIKYIKDKEVDEDSLPVSYWANTSSNSIVRDLVEKAGTETRNEIEELLSGKTITKPVHEDITYGEIYDNQNNLWNFLFFTGYLKLVEKKQDDTSKFIYLTMKIPNKEVDYIYRSKILQWFEDEIKCTKRDELFNALLNKEEKSFEEELKKLLIKTISFNDYYENFYHGFLAGVLTGMDEYMVKSNREAGEGRSDIEVKPVDMEKTAYVFELKVASAMAELDEKAHEAIKQIEDKKYTEELLNEGYTKIVKVGVAFFKKNCRVKIG